MAKEKHIEELKKQYPKFSELMLGDGELVKEHLLISALFIMSYESFKSHVIEYFQSFFADDYDINKNGKPIYKPSKDFEEAYNRYAESEKKEKLFMAACKWLQDMGAFTAEEIEVIRAIKYIRNDIAHELLAIVGCDQKPSIDKDAINIPINLLSKVSNWWIREVESGINPRFSSQYDEKAISEACSIQVHILSNLKKKILDEE